MTYQANNWSFHVQQSKIYRIGYFEKNNKKKQIFLPLYCKTSFRKIFHTYEQLIFCGNYDRTESLLRISVWVMWNLDFYSFEMKKNVKNNDFCEEFQFHFFIFSGRFESADPKGIFKVSQHYENNFHKSKCLLRKN